MKYINKKTMSLILFVLFNLTLVNASKADQDYTSYDDIVRELSSKSTYSYAPADIKRDELIRIHGGLAIVTSRLNLSLPASLPQEKTMQGYEFQIGIDLFSPNWVAMGAVRSFDPGQLGTGNIQMREFDLSVLYKNNLKNPFVYTVGAGLTSRYIDITGALQENFNRNNTTPASIFTLGIDAAVVRSLSLGVQFSYRSPLVSDTIDKGSIDGSFHITGHF